MQQEECNVQDSLYQKYNENTWFLPLRLTSNSRGSSFHASLYKSRLKDSNPVTSTIFTCPGGFSSCFWMSISSSVNEAMWDMIDCLVNCADLCSWKFLLTTVLDCGAVLKELTDRRHFTITKFSDVRKRFMVAFYFMTTVDGRKEEENPYRWRVAGDGLWKTGRLIKAHM